MQLKMRENSLFAVLLRSPWWYSLGIAALLLMVGHLLLRGHYQVIGIALGLPFVVIAAIARYRQSQTPNTRQLQHTDAWVRSARARDLVAALSAGYQQQGYRVTPFEGKAADLEIEKDGYVCLVNCKRVKAANTGVEPLHAFVAAGERREAAKLIYVTLGEVSADARKFAATQHIELPPLEALTKLIAQSVRDDT